MARWQSASGSELEERLILGRSLEELLPETPAIYMWRRHLRAPRLARSSPAGFQEWVDRELRTPVATLRQMELSHYAIIETLHIGGQGLSSDKQSTLAELSRSPMGRAYVAQFLQSLATALPSVYVGEAIALRTRAREHLQGDSGLKTVLQIDMGLEWTALDLWYYELPRSRDDEEPKALRTLLEMIASRLTIAPCVRRVG